MKPRHAASLALVGWYLMVPPAIPDIGEVNQSAPLKQWTIRLLFADNQGCEAAKASLHQQELAAETQRDALAQRVRNPELHCILCNAQCVATDDPRLKER